MMTEEENQQAAHIEHLANQEKDQESIGGEWQPGNDQQQAESEGMSSGEVLTPVVYMLFNGLARIRGGHWQITEQQANEAGHSFGNCLDHYYGKNKLPPWMDAALTGGALLLPPVLAELAISAQKKQQTEEPPKDEKRDKGLDDGD